MSDSQEYEYNTPQTVPWYKGATDTRPFELSKLVKANGNQAYPIYSSSTFPWSSRSLETLWDGDLLDKPEWVDKWRATVRTWIGTIAAGSVGRVYLFPRLASSRPTTIKFIDEKREIDENRKVLCCAWGLSKDAPTDPLLIIASSSLIFIVDAKTQKLVGRLRGHGGEITSIAVHPYHPYIFCTTSKDQSTRVYDLTLSARQKPNNVHWPPDTRPSLAGPAFGLQCSESEGDGLGRCVAVFVGGRSGGHEAAVLGAAFHPTNPLVATCGMDRAVKVWRLPALDPDKLAREDKPLFSTDLLHKARVTTVFWLQQDVLISQSAPAWMRRPNPNSSGQDDEWEYYQESGTVIVWRWLGFDRFFPVGKPMQKVLRGVASDYRCSDSFKILSSYSLPMSNPKLHVYRSITHDPIVVVPMGTTARILNITHFKAREPPAFPLDDNGDDTTSDMVQLRIGTKRIRLDPEADDTETEGRDGKKNAKATTDKMPQPKARPPRSLLDSVPGWELPFPRHRGEGAALTAATLDNQNCEIACEGRVVVGVGSNGTMIIWKLVPT